MLTLDAGSRGPQEPLQTSPPRRRGSVRRTSSIDTHWPNGFTGDAVVDARARDLATSADGATLLDEVVMTLRIGPRREILEIATSDGATALSPLVGATVGPGFRATVADVVPDIAGGCSPLHLLLDDLPGAGLVSGYAMLAGGTSVGFVDPDTFDRRAGLCAGWVRDGVMMVAIRETGQVPTPVGPAAGALEPLDDPLAWHELPHMPPVSTRRRRLIDVSVGGPGGIDLRVDALFRDSHADEAGTETSFHEYSVAALVDRDQRLINAISATPHVLPWTECPAAARSAARLVGQPVAGLRGHVRAEFRGPSTCTHLDDTMRSLADVDGLAAYLDEQSPVG